MARSFAGAPRRSDPAPGGWAADRIDRCPTAPAAGGYVWRASAPWASGRLGRRGGHHRRVSPPPLATTPSREAAPPVFTTFVRTTFLTHGGVSPLPPPVPVPPSAAVCLGAGSGVTGLDRVDVHARTRCRFGATHLRAATVGFGRQSARVVPTDSAVGRDVAPTDSARSVSQWQLVVT